MIIVLEGEHIDFMEIEAFDTRVHITIKEKDTDGKNEIDICVPLRELKEAIETLGRVCNI